MFFCNILYLKGENINGDHMKILITGACSGIGFLTGVTLASRGHKVIMTTHTNKQIETLNIKLKKLNLDIQTFKLDLNCSEDINKLKEVDIDILINHAGIGIGGSLIDLDIGEVRKNYEINFFRSFELVKVFCKNLIRKKKSGKVIITSSIAGVIPFEFLGSYCSSKAAITMMARCLRKELKMIDSNIDVSVIEPGAYKTGFNKVMIDTVEESISNKSSFYYKKKKILNILKFKFNIIERRSLNTIVYQIIKCVEDKDTKFIYSAPFFQSLMKKVYTILFY